MDCRRSLQGFSKLYTWGQYVFSSLSTTEYRQFICSLYVQTKLFVVFDFSVPSVVKHAKYVPEKRFWGWKNREITMEITLWCHQTWLENPRTIYYGGLQLEKIT